MSTEIEQYISNKKKEVKNGFISAFIAVFIGAFLIYIDWPILGGIILVLGGLSFFWNLYIKKENINKKYLDFRFNTMRLIKNDWLQHNWQLKEDETPFFIKYSYIWHFTGCSIEERSSLMLNIWDQTKHLYV
jgi:hypothetical protein